MTESPIPHSTITEAARLLKDGGLVAFPTETVYGLGADASNPAAIRRIFQVKGRPSTNPLIVHIADPEDIHLVCDLELHPLVVVRLRKLAPFWPGPLSVVVPRRPTVPDEVTASQETVAVRVPAHDVARAIIRAAGIPVAAPSANPSNYVSPTTAAHVRDGLSGKVDLIVDGGSCAVGLESTVLSISGATPIILRPGGITREAIEEALGEPVTFAPSIPASAVEAIAVQSPGQLREHYAPRTPLQFLLDPSASPDVVRRGLIAFGPDHGSSLEFVEIRILSENRDLNQVASRLFATLRELDNLDLDLILVDSCANEGLGVAIMDRLRRAVAGHFKLAPPNEVK